MSPYSEDRKQPWGAVVVVIAVLIFGGIIIAWYLGAFCPASGPNCKSVIVADPSLTDTVPPNTVVIDFYSSNTTEDWINAVTDEFNQAQNKTGSGQPIFVRVTHVTSGGSMQDILDGKIQPTVWKPGDQSWVDKLNQTKKDLGQSPLVTQACPATIYAAIGFAMWRPMAEAMGWPGQSIGWREIVGLAADPQGWAKYGNSQWGQFKFGHTNPHYSNSGMLMLTALVYSTLGLTNDLTPQLVRSSEVLTAMRELELHTYHYGEQSRALLERMRLGGSDYLHATTSTEAETLKYNLAHQAELEFPLVFITPAEGVFWTGQLYCILDAPWVTPDQKEAAEIYRDYLLAQPQQERAIDFGLRPLDTAIPLHCPLCLTDGTDPQANPQTIPDLGVPSAPVVDAVQDAFDQTKRKATVVLVLDISGSMQGDPIKKARESAANFIGRLHTDDYALVLTFNNQVTELQPSGLIQEVGDELKQKVGTVIASGGTALNDAVCEAVERINTLRATAEAAGDKRLYGIVVLSDGDDTASVKYTENDLLNICLPTGESVEGVRVFTIAFGAEANKDLLLSIANRTNAKSFSADLENIEKVWLSISAEH